MSDRPSAASKTLKIVKLPHNKKVIISKEKITDYILSKTHATGKFKAIFFHKAGFDETNADMLVACLKRLAKTGTVKETSVTPYGKKFVLEGKIKTPAGKSVGVRTVWIIESAQKTPRFITAYPV